MPPCKSIWFSVFLAFTHVSAYAADPAYSADLLGQGQVGYAANQSNLALLTNPGLVGASDRYDYGVSGLLGPYGATQLAISAVDSQTAKNLSMGFSYVGDKSESTPNVDLLPGWSIPGEEVRNVRREHNLVLIVGTTAFQRRLSVGISGAYSVYKHDLQGTGSTGNVDVGMAAHITRWLLFGGSGRNLLPIDGAGAMPLTTGAGFKLYGPDISLLADGSWQPDAKSPFTAGGGLAQSLGEVTKVRLGFRYDGPARRQDITAGLGFRTEDGGIDFGVAVPADGRAEIGSSILWSASVVLAAPDLETPPG